MTMAPPPDQRISQLLTRAQHALRHAADESLRQHGVTAAQYATLCALASSDGVSGAELARRCFVTPQTIQEIVANLERLHLIERRRDGGDGRALHAYLTPKGQQSVEACHQAVAQVEERMVGDLGKKERKRLYGALSRCVASLEVDAKPKRNP